MTACALAERAGCPQLPHHPARPLPEMVHQYSRPLTYSTTEEPIAPEHGDHQGSEGQVLSENHQNDFSDAETNRRRICDLLWLAFSGCKSAREVQLRAAVYLGRDERTIRYWMEGATGGPRWDEFAKLGGLVGFEVLLRVIYGRR